MSKEMRRYLNDFERKVKKVIRESIVDLVSNKLSDIFDKNGKVKKEVVEVINNGIYSIKNNFTELKIIDYFIVGASVTYQYGSDSDIDIQVVIDKDTSKEFMTEVDDWIELNLDNKFYYKLRPYQFKLSYTGKENLNNFDSAYDSKTQTWLKKPNYDKHIEMFDKKIYDIESIEHRLYGRIEKSIQPSLKMLYYSLMSNDLEKIDKKINSIYNRYKIIKNLRKNSYSTEIESGYVSKNWNKGNVIYKMLDDEGYGNVFSIIKLIIENNNYYDVELLGDLYEKLSLVMNDEIGYIP